MGERKREGVDIWKEREGETGVKMVKTGERDRIFSSVVPFPCEATEERGNRWTDRRWLTASREEAHVKKVGPVVVLDHDLDFLFFSAKSLS
jgi:hypothetical protein